MRAYRQPQIYVRRMLMAQPMCPYFRDGCRGTMSCGGGRFTSSKSMEPPQHTEPPQDS